MLGQFNNNNTAFAVTEAFEAMTALKPFTVVDGAIEIAEFAVAAAFRHVYGMGWGTSVTCEICVAEFLTPVAVTLTGSNGAWFKTPLGLTTDTERVPAPLA